MVLQMSYLLVLSCIHLLVTTSEAKLATPRHFKNLKTLFHKYSEITVFPH